MLAWVRAGLLCAAIAACGSAQAEWRVSSGPTTTVLYEDLGAQVALLFGCAGGNLSFGIGSEFLGPLPAEEDEAFLSIQIDDGVRYEASATYQRNEQGGFDAMYLATDEIPTIVGEIIAAKSSIRVQLAHMLYGETFNWTAGAKGSTKAGRAFVEACKMAPPAAAAAPTWHTRILPESSDGGQLAVLIGGLERGGQLYASCDGQGGVLLGLLAPGLPYEVGDVGLNLHVEIDGEDRTATGEYFDGGDGQGGVAYTGIYIADVVRDILAARAGVRMRVQDYSDGSITEWSAMDLSGLTEAGAAFSGVCDGSAPAVAEMSRVQNRAAADPAVDWTVALDGAVSVPGVKAVLMGVTSPAAGFVQMTCSLDAQHWTIGFANQDVSGFPVGKNDGPFIIRLDVNGEAWSFADARYEEGPEGAVVIADGGSDIAALVTVLMLSFDPIALTVADVTSGREHTYSIGFPGLGEASGAMYRSCLGTE